MHNYKIHISWDVTILGHLKKKAVEYHWEIVLGHQTSELKLFNDEVLLGSGYNLSHTFSCIVETQYSSSTKRRSKMI